MTLKDREIGERRRLTKPYPILIVSAPKKGKSRSIEQLSEEDRMRTVYIDIENKGLPNLLDEDFFRVIRIKPSGIIPEERAKLYEDYENVKFLTLTELQNYIRKVLAHPDVDRIVIDSFTALVDQLEAHFVTVHNGYTVWTTYSKELTAWFSLLKEETRFNAKYVYMLGHYVPSKDKKDLDAEKFCKVKGTMHYRMVEANFNSVITIDDHKFVADNNEEYDSTRINELLNPLETEDNSIAELEQLIADKLNPKSK